MEIHLVWRLRRTRFSGLEFRRVKTPFVRYPGNLLGHSLKWSSGGIFFGRIQACLLELGKATQHWSPLSLCPCGSSITTMRNFKVKNQQNTKSMQRRHQQLYKEHFVNYGHGSVIIQQTSLQTSQAYFAERNKRNLSYSCCRNRKSQYHHWLKMQFHPSASKNSKRKRNCLNTILFPVLWWR